MSFYSPGIAKSSHLKDRVGFCALVLLFGLRFDFSRDDSCGDIEFPPSRFQG